MRKLYLLIAVQVFVVFANAQSVHKLATIPNVMFTANDSIICAGDSVQFNDLSTNSPTAWKWTFTAGTPATSANQNPTVAYKTAGTYTVKLVVSNSSGADSLTKTSFIHVNAVPSISITA